MEIDDDKLFSVTLRDRKDGKIVIAFTEYTPPVLPRLLLPDRLQQFDPDPSGKHGMSDQKRLDVAWSEWDHALATMIRSLKY